MPEMRGIKVIVAACPRSTNARELDEVLAGVEFAFHHSNWASVISVEGSHVRVNLQQTAWRVGGEERASLFVTTGGAADRWLRANETREVIEEKKPRIRDRFNPLYYIRKELQKMSETFTEATDRIEQKISDVNANLEALKTNVANEAAQFKAVVEELRGMSTNGNLTPEQSGRLGALADQLDTSATNIKAAAEGVKGIVPDTPVDPPAPLPAPAPPTSSAPSPNLPGGTPVGGEPVPGSGTLPEGGDIH